MSLYPKHLGHSRIDPVQYTFLLLDGGPLFQEMISFFQSCHELHLEVMRSVALGLGLPVNFFDELVPLFIIRRGLRFHVTSFLL